MAATLDVLLGLFAVALVRGSTVGSTTCSTLPNTDTVEKEFAKTRAATPVACCAACEANPACGFATHSGTTCYLKNGKTMTRTAKDGVTLVVRTDKPAPPPAPPSPPNPPSPPVPPLPPAKYKVELVEHNALPALSHGNPAGQGGSPCTNTFNPSYVEIAGLNKVGGIIVRTDGCNKTNGHLSFAPCNVTTGVCGDLEPSYQVDPSQGTQDPRIIFNKYDGFFYMFTYGTATHGDTCTGPGAPGACTVLLSRTQTPAVARSWTHVPGGTYPWHRNGCCWMEPAGQKTYCIFGESGSEGRGSGLGIAYTTDIAKGQFTQVNWTAGVPGDGGVGLWMSPLGADQQEIKLEAGTHMVQLDSGDLLHFYAAATPGWVADGNYTAGYIVLDKDEPTRIIQRGSGQFLVPTYPFETLCNHRNTPDPGKCKYSGERRNVIFLCSATAIGTNRFRLFFGGGDGNVGTGVVEVSDLTRPQ